MLKGTFYPPLYLEYRPSSNHGCGKHKALVRFAALPFTILPVLLFLRSFTCSRENITLK